MLSKLSRTVQLDSLLFNDQLLTEIRKTVQWIVFAIVGKLLKMLRKKVSNCPAPKGGDNRYATPPKGAIPLGAKVRREGAGRSAYA